VLERTQYREGVREIDLVSEDERERVYGMEIPEIKDSPGLAIDISFITAFHARLCGEWVGRNREVPIEPRQPKPMTSEHRDAFVEKPESAATSILPKMQTKARNQSTS
jgi:hypothetical protein